MTPTPHPGGRLVVVLSTFNGAKYVGEQIESLRRQTLRDWTLLVRDDGSSDETVALIEAAAAADRRVVLVRDGRGNLGPAASFGALLERAAAADAAYVALCDQDDVWQADKLERELRLLRAREARAEPGLPLLVHSDLTVVREDLGLIHPSFMQYQGLRHDGDEPLRKLLVQNFVTGCTAVMNRPLLHAAIPFPTVVMHDWWLALCAAALGEILFLPEPTVLYRQHGTNTLGSRSWASACLESVRRPFAWWRLSGSLFAAAVAQACELAGRVERQGRELTARYPSLPMLRDFCHAFANGCGPLDRLRTVRRHRILPRSLLPYPVCYYGRVLLWEELSPRTLTARKEAHADHA